MPAQLLDPWVDASLLAMALNDPRRTVVIALGAEWCSRCTEFQPAFLAQAQEAPEQEHWLWLNLEEHAELLGEFEPETLPLVWVYRGSTVSYGQAILPDDSTAAHFVYQALPFTPEADIGIQLRRPNWAM